MNEQKHPNELAAQLTEAQKEAANWKKIAQQYRHVANTLARQLIYLCLKWLPCLALAEKSGLTNRATAKKEWFQICEERLPQSKEELRAEVRKIKTKLEELK